MAEKEYIEKEALIEMPWVLPDKMTRKEALACLRNIVKEAPAADVVEVRHGEWKDNHCTACGMMPMGEELWDSCEFAPPRFELFMDYCPNCGAKMDGKEDEGK